MNYTTELNYYHNTSVFIVLIVDTDTEINYLLEKEIGKNWTVRFLSTKTANKVRKQKYVDTKTVEDLTTIVSVFPKELIEIANDKKEEADKHAVFGYVLQMLGDIIPDHCGEVADNVADKVLENLRETADEDFNGYDVKLALGRVLAELTKKE